MKLVNLISCDVYRDGGSYEGIWMTSENKNWAVTLLIVNRVDPKEIRRYRLYNCKRNDIGQYSIIEKDSKENKLIIATIKNWIKINEQSLNNDRLLELLTELSIGNY
jgi:hypothetical protein